MSELTTFLSVRWPEVVVFLLVLGRTGGLMISAPFWSGAILPPLVRVLAAVALSLAVYPLVRSLPSTEPTFFSLLWSLGREILLGLGLGWLAQMFFAGVRLAGQELEIKMGLGLAQLLDPQEGGQTTVLSTLLNLSAALVFFAINGHHLLIQALASSYTVFPLTAGSGSALVGGSGLARVVIGGAGHIFTIALRVSAPAVVGLLLVDLILGLMNRAVPQMNVFIVAQPVQFVFGLLLLLWSLPAVMGFFVGELSGLGRQLAALGLG